MTKAKCIFMVVGNNYLYAVCFIGILLSYIERLNIIIILPAFPGIRLCSVLRVLKTGKVLII